MPLVGQNDVKALKQQAVGRWREILSTLGRCPAEALDGKKHPCPKCGGKDRFRFTNVDGNGSCYCNQCAKSIGDGIAVLVWLRGWDFKMALAELAKHLRGPAAVAHAKGTIEPQIIASYDYCNEAGDVIFQVVRYEPKDFRQRQPKPSGGWEWSVKGLPTIPYRLPELLADPVQPVVIVEGEKDVDNLAHIGVLATCNAGGAKKWRKEHSQYLAGRKVAILPDNDDAGQKHADRVAQSLQGIAETIRIVELPDLPPKGDVSDWLAAGGTKAELERLIDATPIWTPTADSTTKVPRYTPFPTDVLPNVVASFIREGAAALGCDESYVALPLSAMLASAVGNSRRIRLKRTWSEPGTIWAVTVGESGTLKSPAHDLAMKPLRSVQEAALKEHGDRMREYARGKALYASKLDEWRKSGQKKGEPQPDPPTEPVAVRYVVSDCTVEALAVLLERQPRGLLVARDELSGWLNGFDAYKSSHGADVAHWLSMHRAGPLTVDRKGNPHPIHVPRAAVCIAGGAQPRALMAALGGRGEREHFDNGLAARLLVAMPPPRPRRWTENELSEDTEIALETIVGRLLILDMPEDENGQPQARDIPLSPQGKQAWIDFYNAHAREQSAMTGDLAAVWSKLEGYAARLALLIHLIRAESNDPTLANAGAVDERSIAAGVALSRWFGDEAARVYAVTGGDAESPEAREQRELLRIIRDRGGEITVRDLMHASRRYRGSAEQAEKLLHQLVTTGIAEAREKRHEAGGRPAVVYALTEGGNGNGTCKIPEKKRVALPLPHVEKDKAKPAVQTSLGAKIKEAGLRIVGGRVIRG